MSYKITCNLKDNESNTIIVKIQSDDKKVDFSYEHKLDYNPYIFAVTANYHFKEYLNDKSIKITDNDLIEENIKNQIEKLAGINKSSINKENYKESISLNKKQSSKSSSFNKYDECRKLARNKCLFSCRCIKNIIEQVRSGNRMLKPGINAIPTYLDYIDLEDQVGCAKIEEYYIFYTNQQKEIEKLSFEKNNIILGFKDDVSKTIIILRLGYISNDRKKEIKYYNFHDDPELIDNKNDSIYLYNINSASEMDYCSYKYPDFLLSTYDYYNLKLQELRNKNNNYKMEVALDFLHENFNILDNLTIDQGSIILPIFGTPIRLREVQLICYGRDVSKKYNFIDANVRLIKNEDEDDILDEFSRQYVSVDNDISFINFNYSELGERDQSLIKSALLSGNYDKIEICNNISGEIVRINRVIDGIEQCLKEDVVNTNLIDLICADDPYAMSMENKLSIVEDYKPNLDYIKTLREKYSNLNDNEEQLTAIDKIVQMEENDIDVMLIQGPPGTGKTEVILALIKELYELNQKILVTSNVQVACDNVVDKLKNNRNIILKRYSTLNNEDIYQEELVENELKYIKNQILSGYETEIKGEFKSDIILKDMDSYNNLLKLEKEVTKKIKSIDKEKDKYLKNIEEYFKLLEEKDTKVQIFSKQQEAIDSLKEKYSIENKNLISEKNKFDKELKEVKKLDGKVESLKEIKDIISKNKKDCEEKLILYINTRNKNNEDIKSYGELIDKKDDIFKYDQEIIELDNKITFLNNINVSFIISQAKNYLSNHDFKSDEYLNKSFYLGLFKDVLPLFDASIKIMDIIKNDKDFINNGNNLTLKSFDNIYYCIKGNEIYHSFFDETFFKYLNEIKVYYDSSAFKKKFASFIPIIKFNGKSNKYYSNIILEFNNILKEFFYGFETNIKKIIDEHIDLEYVLNEINNLETIKANKIIERDNLKEQINNAEKNKKNIENVENIIIEDKINKCQIKLASENEKFDLQEEAFNNENKKYQDILTKTKEKENGLSKRESENNKLLLEIEQKEKDISLVKDELETINKSIEDYYINNQELIDNKDNFINSRESIKIGYTKSLSIIKENINNFDNRIKELVNNGWTKNQAYDFLFSYIDDLQNISQIEINDSVEDFNKYVNNIDNSFKDLFDIQDTNDGSVISMTTNQIASLLNSDKNLKFDYAIVDEASKCTLEDLIVALPKIKHLVLIGDFMQLDKIYEKADNKIENIIDEEEWDKLNRSNFYQLLSIAVNYNKELNLNSFEANPMVSVMKKQYRMNKGIFSLIKPIYEIHKEFDLIDQKQSSFNDLLVVQIDGDEAVDNDDPSSYNIDEVDAVASILKEIGKNRQKYPEIETIGVITGYSAQEHRIRKMLKGMNKISGLEIGTFDRFQGREYDLVIISMVKTERLGFTKNIRRMNVAMSRAKNHLIILGDFEKLLKASKKEKYNKEEQTIEEFEFVTKNLIPTLYQKRIKYASSEIRNEKIIDFLKEEADE